MVSAREELISSLRSFNADPVIKAYQRDWMDKTPEQILAGSADRTIFRAFRIVRQVKGESPSERFRKWRWHEDPGQLLVRLESIRNQEEFDHLARTVGESLVEDWGERNEYGEPTGMNIGVAMKITNLAFKHLSFSPHCRNPLGLIEWLHLPWDSRTLGPLREIWTGSKPIPRSPGQGFVDSLSLYYELHSFITEIARQSGVYRIIYEFYAWDASRGSLRRNSPAIRLGKGRPEDTSNRKSHQRGLIMVDSDEKARQPNYEHFF